MRTRALCRVTRYPCRPRINCILYALAAAVFSRSSVVASSSSTKVLCFTPYTSSYSIGERSYTWSTSNCTILYNHVCMSFRVYLNCEELEKLQLLTLSNILEFFKLQKLLKKTLVILNHRYHIDLVSSNDNICDYSLVYYEFGWWKIAYEHISY